MSFATPGKFRSLQRKLCRKAKAEPAFRFYLLYDKVASVRDRAFAPGRSKSSGLIAISITRRFAAMVSLHADYLPEDMEAA